MPGKKAKSAKSASASASASATSSAGAGGGPSTTKCAVCDQNVIDGKDQALFCEGFCKGWFHRYCAGVSLAHFDYLSTSAHPFYCVVCFQKSYNDELADLKSTVSALRGEITQLREDLARKDCAQTPERRSFSAVTAVAANIACEVRERRGRKHRDRRVSRGGAGRDERVGGGGARKRDMESSGRNVEGSGREGGRSGGRGGGGDGTSTLPPSNAPNTPNRRTAKIPVEGARRVWGTLKVTTTISVKSVIAKFCSVASLKFKRKTICDHDGQIKRWWFVMHGSEDALQILDSKWDLIQAHTCWKLEQCFRPLTEEDTSTSQPLDLQSSNATPADKSSPPPTTGPDSVEKLSDSQSTPIPTTPFLEN